MIDIKDFIKQHSTELEPLITQHKFDEIYEFLNKDSSAHLLRPRFTDLMLSMNINPLIYMKKIPSYYLSKNLNITTLDIPSNISEIDKYAIQYCDNLITLIIPKSITKIEDKAIDYCYNIRQVRNLSGISLRWAFNPSLSDTCEVITDNSEFKTKLDMISDCLIFTSGNTKSILTCINKDIQSIKNLPSDVSMICYGAFKDCRALNYIKLPDNLSHIDSDAFYNCAGLTDIILPNNLVKIGKNAFSYSGLKSINLPLSVKEINSWCFYGCNNLSDLYYDGTRDNWIDIDWGGSAIPLSCKKHFKE